MPDDVKALLGRALDGEPPLGIDRDEIFAEGRARLRRRRSIAIGGVAMAVVVAALGTTALTGGLLGQPAGDVGPAASASRQALPPSPSTTHSPSTGTPSSGPGISWVELSEAVRPGSTLWPSEVTGVRGTGQGPGEFQFRGPVLTVHLASASGGRRLTITIEPSGTLRLFCRAGEDCHRQENVDGTVIRTKIDHDFDREIVLVNVRRANGREISVVESPADDHGRPGRLLPVELIAKIGTLPGMG